MKVFSSKRRVVAAAAIVLLLLFFLRPGASRLKSRIIASVSSAMGRPVDIGSVHVRLLPRPGFDLENLVVYEDPRFGAEPMLRAGEVTAALRLTSLLRGRLEIARLDLTEPSMNLVHGENGGWNVETLLERTARSPLAPTGKAKSEPRPGFPYIQATSARINFKRGPEKKPYALANADFSLWQDSENTWGVRLKAQPLRADLNLNDTGILQVSGTWQRAAVIRDTPLEFSVEWSRAQLGQVTKLLTNSDQGWRGGVQLDLKLTGTPANLQIAAESSVADFRRYDITSGRALRLAAHCDGHYSTLDRMFRDVACIAPVESGLIALKGALGLPGSHIYDLTLTAEDVPTNAAILLAERVKKNLPDDLSGEGTIGGSVAIQENGAAASPLLMEGKGEIANLLLASSSNEVEVGPETVALAIKNDAGGGRRKMPGRKTADLPMPNGPHIEFGPFPVATGRTATARGWADASGYDISVKGDADLWKTLRVARMFGLAALQTSAEGTADLDLQVGGSWAGWSYGSQRGIEGAQVTGTARLHNVRAPIRGLNAPLEILAASLELSPDGVHAGKISARTGDTVWSGSLDMPRGCGTVASCEVRINLTANQISLSALSALATPGLKERPWYRILGPSGQSGPSLLESVRAAGSIRTEFLQVENLSATHVSATLSLDRGRVRVSDLNTDFLGGKHHGEWEADFRETPSICRGKGKLIAPSLARASEIMNDEWIAGAANASYEVQGPCSAEFWKSAEGTLKFELRDGEFPHIALSPDEGPLKFSRLSGIVKLLGGNLEIKDAGLESPSGKFQLSGTAGLDRRIEFKLARPANGALGGYAITGTLAEPRVAPLAEAEQARLKP